MRFFMPWAKKNKRNTHSVWRVLQYSGTSFYGKNATRPTLEVSKTGREKGGDMRN